MDKIAAANQTLIDGGIIAYPTEAVYGLGCDPMNETAVMHLLAIKHRSVDKGLILIAATPQQLANYIDISQLKHYPDVLESWPGPHTWLFPCYPEVPIWIRGQHKKLAVRVTAHSTAAQLCLAFGGAIISTSANIAKQAPAKNIQQVREQFNTQLDYILTGETNNLNETTPIRDAQTGQKIR